MKLAQYRHLLTGSLHAVADGWQEKLETQLSAIFAQPGHGHFPQWLDAVNQLSATFPSSIDLTQAIPEIGLTTDIEEQAAIKQALMNLQPWRKGPFSFCGVALDSEWRCDLKWQRMADHLPDLAGKTVLDVGCGNGYYMLRMLGAGAQKVIGVDPTLLFLAQFCALTQNIQPRLHAHLLPIPFEQLLPELNQFDVIFSMGVLYHRREPQEHCQRLHAHLAEHGWLLLETLVINEQGERELIPADRYAGMRNVWTIPSPAMVIAWLHVAGFENAQCHSIKITDTHEQRATEWMQNYSLQQFLDPHDTSKTAEGYPAPTRAIFSARKSS